MTSRLFQSLRKEMIHIIIIFFLSLLTLYLRTFEPLVISAFYIGFLKKRRYGDINNFDDLSNANKTACILIMFIISISLMGSSIMGKTVNNIISIFVSLRDYVKLSILISIVCWFGYRVLIMKKFQTDINKQRLAFEIAYFFLYVSLVFSIILQ
jgi:hypothetical protein